ncbi:MAG: hypothetical protein O3A00_17600, partial [Planctomycetota bacterium]|nr:hypothetical protein [Planctomycetota bacterium]
EPLYSGFHFYGSIAILPYKTSAKPMDSCEWSLGHYRPGNNVPPYYQDMKADLKSFSYQGLITSMLFYMWP